MPNWINIMIFILKVAKVSSFNLPLSNITACRPAATLFTLLQLCVLMFHTSDNSQLLRSVLWINAELTIVWSLKHKNTQPSYIFNRENSQKSEPQNGPRRGLDFIALVLLNQKKSAIILLNPGRTEVLPVLLPMVLLRHDSVWTTIVSIIDSFFEIRSI